VSDVVIRAEGLRKRYRLGRREAFRTLRDAVAERVLSRGAADPAAREIWALDGVTFEVREGEILGIVGRNGTGKTTLLKILSRITEPTEGQAEIRGRVGSLLEVGTGFHPELTGRENVFLNGAILGMRRREIDEKLDAIVDFSGVERFLETPLKFYSTGMAVRLGFAVAAHLEPEILIVDEVLAVGDAAFQERCLGKMRDVATGGRTVLFVSHNMGAISALCPETMWLDAGQVRHRGPSADAISTYLAFVRSRGPGPVEEGAARRGSGVVRVRRLALEDELGRPVDWVRPGEPVRIAVEYEADAATPLRDLTVRIVLSAQGRPIASFLSDIAGPDLGDAPRAGRAVCSIPSLPLGPGAYDVRFSVLLGRELADKLEEAATLVVAEGDFFGTGRLPQRPETYGPLLVPQSWSVEPLPPRDVVPSETTVAHVDAPAR
jgi:lipopolysaccharide transport system ATP-binding protein